MPESTMEKVLWLARHRPVHLLRTIRGYVLFRISYSLRFFFPLPRVKLGANVRLQKNFSVMAEAPDASISIGEDSIVYEDCKLEAYGKGSIAVGSHSVIGGARIISRYGVEIGRRFLCSWNVYIQDFDSHPVNPEERRHQVEDIIRNFSPSFNPRPAAPPIDGAAFFWSFPGDRIVIEDDVWVGMGVTILKGVRIGAGSIVAAGSVVLKGNYPPLSLIAGNPATVVKQINSTQPAAQDDRNHIY